MSKYSKRGVTDIIVVHVGRPYFLKAKRKGTYQSPEQKEFQVEAEKAGALYAVVRSIDDVQKLEPYQSNKIGISDRHKTEAHG